jgi:ATP-binding cassette subfamily F protein uup
VLVLDEPTNDLDIETLELLEELLQDYAGTIFLVSHDRTFLDNVVTQTIAAEGDGIWKEYAGGYEDWLRCRNEAAVAERATPARVTEAKATPKPKSDRLSWKEQRELEALPARIAALEAEQAMLTRRLEDPMLHAQAQQAAAAVASRLASIEAELLGLMERWEALETRF